jgi:cytochrome P450
LTEHHPSLGATFDPLHIQFEQPYAFYAQIRQEEPICFSPSINAYLVSRYDDIRSILSQPDLFASKTTFFSGIEIYPETITELSKGYQFVPSTMSERTKRDKLHEPFRNALSSARIRTMEPAIREIATRLIDRFQSDGQAEIISQFAYPFPLEVLLTILGIPQQDMEMVKKQNDDFRRGIALPLSPEEQVECARQFVTLEHYYAYLVEEKRKHPGQDLISDLIRYGMVGEDPLSDADLINEITAVFNAGYETPAHMIGNGLVLLLEEPTRWQALCEYPERIPQAIEEILRMRGPVLGFMRTTTQELTVRGVIMPPGTNLLLLYAAGNLDENYFPQACDFEMQRQPNHHLAFGHGIHFCVGAALARLEGRITFEALTQRIPRMRLVPDQRFEYYPLFFSYGHKHIHVQWD